jgi:hypothetical protein
MKRTIFLIFFIAFAMVSMAQKGSWYVGGLVGYNISTEKPEADNADKTIYTNWNLNPEFGTFITNTLQIGFVGGLSGYARKVGDNKDYSSVSVNPSVYVRNFYKFTENLSAFAGVYINYINGIDKSYEYSTGSEVETKDSHNGFGTRLGIGIAYALSPRFTVMGQYGLVGFSTIVYKDSEGHKTSTDTNVDFGINTLGSGTAFNVGIYYTFAKGK